VKRDAEAEAEAEIVEREGPVCVAPTYGEYISKLNLMV
jgi:hypothetical protein